MRALAIILGIFFIASCSSYVNIIGRWEDSTRILEFTEDDEFTIEYKNSAEVLALRGTYARDKNTVVLTFEEYQTSNEEWLYANDTKLKDYKEILYVTKEDDCLVTKIYASNKTFRYSSVRK